MKKTIAKRTLSFGRVAYSGNTQRNKVTLEIELREDSLGRPVFSACGNVWQASMKDIWMGGQCIDSIYNKFGDQLDRKELYEEIMELWEKYHLNDMNAGTAVQELVIKKWLAEGNRYDYTKACEHLRRLGLYKVLFKTEDGVDVPYTYGSQWIYAPIPEKDLERIKNLFK